MNRAYSLLEIKEVNEDSRVITGIATTPSPDRAGDVVKPEGAEYTLPIPLLWQHNSSQPIGKVTQAKVTKNGIEIVAEIAQGVTEEIDRAWKLIKSGLVRGLSIGFRGIDVEQIPNSWGVVFEKWEWLELSAVTIPANSEATIQTVKSIDAELLAASGKKQDGDEGKSEKSDPKKTPGVSGTNKTTPVVSIIKPETKRSSAMDVAEQIKSFEDTLNAKQAKMLAIMEESAKAGETLNAEKQEEYDTLSAEAKSINEHLKRLRDMEALQARTAKPVEGVQKAEDGAEVRAGKVPAQIKVRPKLDKGIAFARIARVKALARLDSEPTREVAKSLYGEDSDVFGFFSKAAVSGATTGGQTWGHQLVGDESSAFADFVEYLRPQTILGKFGANGVPALRRVPFRVALVGQTSGGSGYWVGEGKGKPLTKFDFSRTTLEPLKVANIAVSTEEVLRDSSPSAEVIIRDQLAAALRERLDVDFIDPAKTAVSNVSPASITNNISPISATGTGDADDVRTDVKKLFSAFIAANNAPTSGVFIMPATMALALSLMTNPLGQPEFPGLTMNGGTFFGLPVIVSEYVPTITGGSYIVLANASDIYLADDGGIQVDMSREASLQMDNAPTMTSDSPTGTSVVSMWQTNSVAFRAERTINWARRRSSAVAVLSGANWGTVA